MAGTELGHDVQVQTKAAAASEQIEAKPLTEKDLANQQLLGEFLESTGSDVKSKGSDEPVKETAKRPLGSVKELGLPTVTIEDDKKQSELYRLDREMKDRDNHPAGDVKNPLASPMPYYPAPEGYTRSLIPVGPPKDTKK